MLYIFSAIIFLIHVLPSDQAKFDIDTNDAVVRNGCIEMMKSAVRQQRHRLKKDHFDPFPLIWLQKLLLSNQQVMISGWTLQNHGRIPTKWYSIPKIPTSTLYMILWHLSNMYSLYDVGGMSKEQRQPRQRQVPSNNWLLQLPGFCRKLGKCQCAVHVLASSLLSST